MGRIYNEEIVQWCAKKPCPEEPSFEDHSERMWGKFPEGSGYTGFSTTKMMQIRAYLQEKRDLGLLTHVFLILNPRFTNEQDNREKFSLNGVPRKMWDRVLLPGIKAYGTVRAIKHPYTGCVQFEVLHK